MLGRRNQHALPHQAGGVADFGYLLIAGRNREVLQVGSKEDNAGRGRSRYDSNSHGDARMQADAGSFYWSLDRRFVAQWCLRYYSLSNLSSIGVTL